LVVEVLGFKHAVTTKVDPAATSGHLLALSSLVDETEFVSDAVRSVIVDGMTQAHLVCLYSFEDKG
jgi:hypothetical protein